MSWRPSRASAKSSQSSRFASGTGRVRSTTGLGLTGLAWGRLRRGVSCFGGLAEEGVHLPDLREGRVRVDRRRLRLPVRDAADRGSSVHLVGAVEQARLVERPEPQGAPGVHQGLQPPVRGARRSSGPRGSCRAGSPRRAVGQVVRAPDVDGAADLALGDAQALDDQVPQVLGPAGQRLQPLDLGELLAADFLSDGGLRMLPAPGRRAASASSGASSLASFSPATAPQPSAGSRKWWTCPDGIGPRENG